MNEWRPVTDTEPGIGEEVLLCDRDEVVIGKRYRLSPKCVRWMVAEYGEESDHDPWWRPTLWMPLPEVPKEP